ncbi:MAG: lysophospholipid acyltransferase family protein [Candidatus Omnitrophota bacterium]|nr:MAG: lysophospholipid acyltransferase family protein [Candidatus Omnitrophota bacterium]
MEKAERESYLLYIFAKIIALSLPRSLAYAVAKFFALLHYRSSNWDREIVRYNLSPIVKDKEKIEQYTKEVFINFAYYLVDFFRHSRLNQAFIEKNVRISGREHFDKAIAQKKGVIVLSSHLGNYELDGAAISLLGYPVHVVVLPHNDPRVNNFFDNQRRLAGVNVIPTGRTIRRCFSVFKEGGAIGFLGDRDFSGTVLSVEMFSRIAPVPRGAAFFAVRTGAVIVPTFFVRENKKNYHLFFEEPIEFDKEGENAEEAIMKKYASVLEKYLKKYPEQWYMFEKYWSNIKK